MNAIRTSTWTACALALGLAATGCSTEASTKGSPSSRPPTTGTPAGASVTTPPASSAATPAAASSGSASAAACDYTIVPGARLTGPSGEQKLSGTTPLELGVEAGKAYCVFGGRFTSQSVLKDVQSVAPADCNAKPMLGVSYLECKTLGVTLAFPGPLTQFLNFSLYPPAGKAAGPPGGVTIFSEM